ncbi:MAG: precorrin-6A reductase [Oscillospiraceae bacterium]|nr:precorrin-6A reductase [Oscillospiraceae bacterium]
MNVLIFGGTTEGRELSWALAELGARVTVCVASAYGEEEQGSRPGIRVLTGPLSREEKLALLKETDLCIDATHPYARHVSTSVQEACQAAGIEYVRLQRLACPMEGALRLESADQAAAWLREHPGNVLLTTGSRELQAFRGLDPERLYPRVLPSHEALSACEALGIPHRNILAMQGPFSQELNEALIRQYAIAYVVTKDGGVPGGFPEKAAAARATGARLLVLARPDKEGLCYEDVLGLCTERLTEKAPL